MQIVQTLVGAGIALLGVVLAQVWQDRRWEQRGGGGSPQAARMRNHDARRAALLGFLARVDEVANQRSEEVVLSPEDSPSIEWERVWLSLSAARAAVDVYGVSETRASARQLEGAVVALVEDGDHDGCEDVSRNREVYIARVRDELDI